MKLYGYSADSDTLHNLVEITIQADPKRLRNLALFFEKTANLIEKHGDKFGHEHYCDNSDNPPKNADIVIACPVEEKSSPQA